MRRDVALGGAISDACGGRGACGRSSTPRRACAASPPAGARAARTLLLPETREHELQERRSRRAAASPLPVAPPPARPSVHAAARRRSSITRVDELRRRPPRCRGMTLVPLASSGHVIASRAAASRGARAAGSSSNRRGTRPLKRSSIASASSRIPNRTFARAGPVRQRARELAARARPARPRRRGRGRTPRTGRGSAAAWRRARVRQARELLGEVRAARRRRDPPVERSRAARVVDRAEPVAAPVATTTGDELRRAVVALVLRAAAQVAHDPGEQHATSCPPRRRVQQRERARRSGSRRSLAVVVAPEEVRAPRASANGRRPRYGQATSALARGRSVAARSPGELRLAAAGPVVSGTYSSSARRRCRRRASSRTRWSISAGSQLDGPVSCSRSALAAPDPVEDHPQVPVAQAVAQEQEVAAPSFASSVRAAARTRSVWARYSM